MNMKTGLDWSVVKNCVSLEEEVDIERLRKDIREKLLCFKFERDKYKDKDIKGYSVKIAHILFKESCIDG